MLMISNFLCAMNLFYISFVCYILNRFNKSNTFHTSNISVRYNRSQRSNRFSRKRLCVLFMCTILRKSIRTNKKHTMSILLWSKALRINWGETFTLYTENPKSMNNQKEDFISSLSFNRFEQWNERLQLQICAMNILETYVLWETVNKQKECKSSSGVARKIILIIIPMTKSIIN